MTVTKNPGALLRIFLQTALLIPLLLPLRIHAQALENPETGFYASALSGAVTALRSYPEAGAWNPAGLPVARKQDQLLISRRLDTWLLSARNSSAESSSTRFSPGTGVFLVRSRTNWTRAYALYQPYSGPAYRWLGFAGQAATLEGEFTVHAFNAAFAFPLTKALTLGVSAELHYSVFYRNVTYPETTLDDLASISGFSGHMGIQWQATPALTLGAAVRLPGPARISGDSAVNGVPGNTALELLLPPRLSLGLGWQAASNFRLQMDLGAIFWNLSDTVTWERETQPDQEIRTGYKFAFYTTVGILWQISAKLELLYSLRFATGATGTEDLGPTADVPVLTNGAGLKLQLNRTVALTVTLSWHQGLPQSTASSAYSVLETEFNRMKLGAAAGCMISF